MPWLMSIAFVFTMLFSAVMQKNVDDMLAEKTTAEASAIASSMMVYQNYVRVYAINNPAATGSISDAALGLPTWYIKSSSVANYVTAGRAYVYVVNPPVGLVSQLQVASQNSLNVGVNMSGALVGPVGGATGITVPAAIPSGAVVYGF